MREKLALESYDEVTKTFGPETVLLVTSFSGIRYRIDRVGRGIYDRIRLTTDLTIEGVKGTLRVLQIPRSIEPDKRLTVRYPNGTVERVKVFVSESNLMAGYFELVCNGPDERGQ